MAAGNVLERANLRSEGYLRALYVPLGGSKTWRTPPQWNFISPCSASPLVYPSALALL